MPEKTYALVLNLLHNNNNYPLIESTLLDLINFFMNRKIKQLAKRLSYHMSR